MTSDPKLQPGIYRNGKGMVRRLVSFTDQGDGLGDVTYEALSPRRRAHSWYTEDRPGNDHWKKMGYGPKWPPFQHKVFSPSWTSWLGSNWVRLPDDWTSEDTNSIQTVSVPATQAKAFREFCADKGITILDQG